MEKESKREAKITELLIKLETITEKNLPIISDLKNEIKKCSVELIRFLGDNIYND
jgi:hypothetical protein